MTEKISAGFGITSTAAMYAADSPAASAEICAAFAEALAAPGFSVIAARIPPGGYDGRI